MYFLCSFSIGNIEWDQKKIISNVDFENSMFSLCDDAKLTKKWDKYNNKKTRLGHEDEVQGHFCLDAKNPHDIKIYF